MRFFRAVSWFLGLFALAVPVFFYVVYVQYLGFPDGHLTPLERAEKPTFFLFSMGSFVAGMLFLFLGGTSSVEKKERYFKWLVVFFLLWVGLFWGVDLTFRMYLPHGQGG